MIRINVCASKREKRLAYIRAWDRRNHDRRSAYELTYKLKHPQRRKEISAAYRKRNPGLTLKYARKYNLLHKEERRAKGIARYQNDKARVREYLAKHPCVDCGYSDVRALDFDHVRGIKKFTIGKLRNHPWNEMLVEIEKCDIRCANCHRIRHYAS